MSSIMSKMMQEYAEEYAEYRNAEQFIENVNMLSERFNVTTAEACTFLNKTIADYEKAADLLAKFNSKEIVPEPVY